MTAYRLAAAAEEDLQSHLSFIAERDGLDRALQVHAAFVTAFEHLAAAPDTGRLRSDLTGESVRWWPVFSFLVLYDAEARPPVILRVIHGARDIDRLMGR